MKKGKGLLIAITIFTLMFSSSQVLAVKPLEKHNKTENVIKSKEKNDNNQNNEKDKQKNDNNQNKQKDKQKDSLKHIETLNKRLNDIENSLTNINKEIDKYFNVQTQLDTNENENTSSEINNSTTDTNVNLDEKSNTSEETQLNEESNFTNEGGQTAEAEQTVESGQMVENDQVPENEQVTDGEQTVEDEQATEGQQTAEGEQATDVEQTVEDEQTTESEQTVKDEKLDEEFNNEYKEEDNRRYNSFYGKLNSLLNKLDTVKKQLQKGSNNSDELANINERYSKLVNDVTSSINRVKELQQKQVSETKRKYTNKKFEEQKINETKKDWELKLTKGVKDDKDNLKNITILDSKGNVVDTDIKYDALNKKITIRTEDGFIKGESYTILIGGDLESSSGEKLGKNVEKNFTVE